MSNSFILHMDKCLCQTGKLVLERVSTDATFSGSRFKFFIYLILCADTILIRNEMMRSEITGISSSLESREYHRER